jgi:hypothetical protein
MIDPLYDAARRIDDLTAERDQLAEQNTNLREDLAGTAGIIGGLTAERDRLRAALEEIIQELGRGGDAADIHAVIIARRALGEGK